MPADCRLPVFDRTQIRNTDIVAGHLQTLYKLSKSMVLPIGKSDLVPLLSFGSYVLGHPLCHEIDDYVQEISKHGDKDFGICLHWAWCYSRYTVAVNRLCCRIALNPAFEALGLAQTLPQNPPTFFSESQCPAARCIMLRFCFMVGMCNEFQKRWANNWGVPRWARPTWVSGFTDNMNTLIRDLISNWAPIGSFDTDLTKMETEACLLQDLYHVTTSEPQTKNLVEEQEEKLFGYWDALAQIPILRYYMLSVGGSLAVSDCRSFHEKTSAFENLIQRTTVAHACCEVCWTFSDPLAYMVSLGLENHVKQQLKDFLSYVQSLQKAGHAKFMGQGIGYEDRIIDDSTWASWNKVWGLIYKNCDFLYDTGSLLGCHPRQVIKEEIGALLSLLSISPLIPAL